MDDRDNAMADYGVLHGKVPASVARRRRAPPEDLTPQDLRVRNHPNRITRRERLLQRSYRSQV